jgi:hypothetical protein
MCIQEGCGESQPSNYNLFDGTWFKNEEGDAWSAADVDLYNGGTEDDADSFMCKKQRIV